MLSLRAHHHHTPTPTAPTKQAEWASRVRPCPNDFLFLMWTHLLDLTFYYYVCEDDHDGCLLYICRTQTLKLTAHIEYVVVISVTTLHNFPLTKRNNVAANIKTSKFQNRYIKLYTYMHVYQCV